MSRLANTFAQAKKHHQHGRFAKAEQYYRQLLRAAPTQTEGWCGLGAAYQAQGKLQEAVAAYHQGLVCDKANARIHLGLGTAHFQQGQTGEAISRFKEALRLRPGYADAHYNLGLTLKSLGQREAALLQFQLALRGDPEMTAAAVNLEECLAQAPADLPVDPRQHLLFVRAYCNLGIVRAKEGKLDEAIGHYRRALQLKPDDADAHHSLGAAQQQLGLLPEAVASYREALQCQPDFAETHCNLGYALMDMARFEEAMPHLDEAVRLKPDFAAAHGTRSQLRLFLGDLKQGWPEYEWRWRQPGVTPRDFTQPLWNGWALDGRTILLHAEQGLGDTIQFIRYAALVKERGGEVIVECQPSLRKLLAGVEGIDRLVPQGPRLPAFDLHAPLLSLPGILRTSLETIPNQIPYLSADPKLVKQWERPLAMLRGLKIGIAWQGNPHFRDDSQRSMPLTAFAALAKVPGVQLINLQKGPGAEQVSASGKLFSVIDFGDRLDKEAGPFMDTAAIMKGLDLVIASDSAVAHLAGALGVRVWVALGLVPNWRWLCEREDSPWYPTMRLFRQRRAGDWSDVFERLALEIGALRAT